MNQTAAVFITVNNWETSKCPIMGLVKYAYFHPQIRKQHSKLNYL